MGNKQEQFMGGKAHSAAWWRAVPNHHPTPPRRPARPPGAAPDLARQDVADAERPSALASQQVQAKQLHHLDTAANGVWGPHDAPSPQGQAHVLQGWQVGD